MPKIIDQDISVLSAAKHGLVYLTANDWMLIADKAVRMTFKPGDSIVHQGRRTNGVYLVLKGTIRVQIPGEGRKPEIRPGEICGEMSYLDELPASASAVAQDPVEAFFLDRPTLQSLFELFPHLASRFYRSLATNLSSRLRDVIGQGPMAGSRKS